MLGGSVWQRLLGLDRQVVVERVEFDEEAAVVVAHVRPRRGRAPRCGRCGRAAARYDGGRRRRWRTLDLGSVRAFVEGEAPRVLCGRHGVVVAQVPWARHGAGHTRAFDDTVAWLVTQASKTATAELLRVAWRTVGAIVARVVADIDAGVDRLAGLGRIGIDEIAYKRGHRYLTVVVDHDSGRLVWAAPGRDEPTLHQFFDLLGDRCADITHVSADAADWIQRAVRERCPNAVIAADPFHVVKWAVEALDEVRRHAWNAARQAHLLPTGRRARQHRQHRAHPIKQARYALWKNPENLTHRQAAQLDWIAKTQPQLHRAYLLKEGLRVVFRLGGDPGKDALDHWITWARRSRIPAFVDLQRRIITHRAAIHAALDSGLSNALIESTNTKIRLLTRLAFGFHHPNALIALALLALGGHRPSLPGRP